MCASAGKHVHCVPARFGPAEATGEETLVDLRAQDAFILVIFFLTCRRR